MSYQKEMQVEEKTSDWKGCCAATCPIPPSVSVGGHQYCRFHQGHEYNDFDRITTSVKNNLSHYLYYRKVTQWGAEQWKHNVQNLRNYEVCSILTHEEGFPIIYEQRLLKAITAKIKQEAGV